MMNYLNSLSSRDRKVLSLAIPVILLLVFILLMNFFYSERKQAEQRLQQSLDDLSWVESSPAIFSTRKCIPLGQQSAVQALSKTLGVKIKINPSDVTQLEIAQSPGNQVLVFLERLSCDGWKIEVLQLTTTPGGVFGNARFTRL